MGFFRRLLGGGPPRDDVPSETADAGPAADAAGSAVPAAPIDTAEDDAEERAHELEVLREEQARLDDLAQRQLKYARYAWQPPRQGGERRADDADEAP